MTCWPMMAAAFGAWTPYGVLMGTSPNGYLQSWRHEGPVREWILWGENFCPDAEATELGRQSRVTINLLQAMWSTRTWPPIRHLGSRGPGLPPVDDVASAINLVATCKTLVSMVNCTAASLDFSKRHDFILHIFVSEDPINHPKKCVSFQRETFGWDASEQGAFPMKNRGAEALT